VVAGSVAGALVIAVGGRRRLGAGLLPRRAAAPAHARGAAAATHLGRGLVGASAVLALAVVGWRASLALSVLVGVVPWFARAQRTRRFAEATARELPDLVDLFAIAASAGHPVARALECVAPRSPPSVAPAVRAAAHRRRRGRRLDEVLAGLGEELGPAGRALVDALRQSATTGAPLGPLLREVGGEARDARRRRAQEAARRLPVTMLLPLAGCVLPAALLLAVVPVVLVSFASLSG
jgi:Flp pilus assembly protein TadB